MIKLYKQIISLTLSFILLCSSPVSALAIDEGLLTSNDLNSSITDFLVSAFEAGESINKLEQTYEGSVTFKFQALDTSRLNDEWKNDALAFTEGYLGPQTEELTGEVSLQKAQAMAITHAIDAAEWSVSQGRASDVVKESTYMFLSHYIDRNDYWWNDGNQDYLLDGELQSGENGMLAKWITDTDRSTYDSYLKTTSVAKASEKALDIFRGVQSLKQNADSVVEAAVDMKRMKTASEALGAVLLEADVPLEGADIVQDTAWLINNSKALFNEDPTLQLTTLYERYMEDDNVFRNYKPDVKGEVIKASLTTVGSYLLAGMTGGGSLVMGALFDATIDFSVEVISDFFDYVAWLVMRYSYSGRYSLRLSDYLFG